MTPSISIRQKAELNIHISNRNAAASPYAEIIGSDGTVAEKIMLNEGDNIIRINNNDKNFAIRVTNGTDIIVKKI